MATLLLSGTNFWQWVLQIATLCWCCDTTWKMKIPVLQVAIIWLVMASKEMVIKDKTKFSKMQWILNIQIIIWKLISFFDKKYHLKIFITLLFEVPGESRTSNWGGSLRCASQYLGSLEPQLVTWKAECASTECMQQRLTVDAPPRTSKKWEWDKMEN